MNKTEYRTEKVEKSSEKYAFSHIHRSKYIYKNNTTKDKMMNNNNTEDIEKKDLIVGLIALIIYQLILIGLGLGIGYFVFR